MALINLTAENKRFFANQTQFREALRDNLVDHALSVRQAASDPQNELDYADAILRGASVGTVQQTRSYLAQFSPAAQIDDTDYQLQFNYIDTQAVQLSDFFKLMAGS